MKNKTIGSDLDGTWTDFKELHDIVHVLVTGNSWENFDDVMDYIEGPKVPIFFNPVGKGKESLTNISNHKADIINKIGIKEFYENDKDQVNLLKIWCPNCKIIWVEDKNFSI